MPTPDDIAHQRNLLDIYRRNLAQYLKQQAMLGEAYAPPAVLNGIREARENIRRIKQILHDLKVPVDNHPDDGDEATLPQEQAPTVAAQVVDQKKVSRIKLRQILTDYFNDDELREICFDLNIDYESLAGTGKSGKARELIAYAERHGNFEELVKIVQQLRPNAAW